MPSVMREAAATRRRWNGCTRSMWAALLALSLASGGCWRARENYVAEDGGIGTQEPGTTLPAVADTYIDQDSPSSNEGSSLFAVVRNSNGGYSGTYESMDTLVRFDLSSLPAYATIEAAYLRMYYYSHEGDDPAGRELTLHRITSPWSESEVNWSTQPSYDSAVAATAVVPDDDDRWISWDVSAEVVEILGSGMTGHGWIIRDEEPYGSYGIPQTKLRTRETEEKEPHLAVFQ